MPNGATQGRKFFDKMGEFATTEEVGAKGLAWTKIEQDDSVTGGIAKFITSDIKEKLEKQIEIYHEKNFIYPTDVFANN